jgi:hypothetical protein
MVVVTTAGVLSTATVAPPEWSRWCGRGAVGVRIVVYPVDE